MSGPRSYFTPPIIFFIQKIFKLLTTDTESTQMWIVEYGLMIPLVVTGLAIFYWRKAKAEGFQESFVRGAAPVFS